VNKKDKYVVHKLWHLQEMLHYCSVSVMEKCKNNIYAYNRWLHFKWLQ